MENDCRNRSLIHQRRMERERTKSWFGDQTEAWGTAQGTKAMASCYRDRLILGQHSVTNSQIFLIKNQ